MLVPSDALYVRPRRRLVAAKALSSVSVRLVRDALRDHFEVHHVVAGRSLVALRTVLRTWRRVLELRNRPRVGGVTISAAAPEKIEVPIVVAVTPGAIEQCLLR